MIHSTEVKVRSYECDSNRHVNNAVYLQYLEYGRTEFLYDNGFDYDAMKEDGYAIFVTRIDIRYLSSAKWGDRLVIRSRPVQKRAASGVFHQSILKTGGETVCEAEVTWAFVNRSGKPVRIPGQFNIPELMP